MPATSAADMDAARKLFREYQQWLGVDLCFQGFDQELASLPGLYAQPKGCILLAKDAAAVAGCVALRPLADIVDGVCEMKRMYVRLPWRGGGFGRRLTELVIGEARARGYAAMRLDTLPHLDAAIQLYRDFGFVEIAPYYDNPLPGVLYLELRLN